jgi:hypothetical protein
MTSIVIKMLWKQEPNHARLCTLHSTLAATHSKMHTYNQEHVFPLKRSTTTQSRTSDSLWYKAPNKEQANATYNFVHEIKVDAIED